MNAVEAAAHGRRTQAAEADRFAANVLPVISALQSAGITNLRGLAAALNARDIPTVRGGKWTRLQRQEPDRERGGAAT